MAYATLPDLYLYGFREEARGDLSDAQLLAALEVASSVVDGHLWQRFGQPLQAYTTEITQWVVALATFELMTGPRGLSSESPDYQVLLDRRNNALEFLRRTQRQDYTPLGLTAVNAPPGTTGIQPLVISFSVDMAGCCVTNRGW